jgi:serine/threonine protein kinase
MPEPIPTLKLNSYFGPYYLIKLIAVGGMAEVYLAQAKGTRGLERQLALKVILPDFADDESFVQMLVDEARLTVRLNHANIVQNFDLGKIGNSYYISMEYMDGLDFFKLLTTLTCLNRELPIEAACWIVSQALLGLDYAHTKCDEQGQPLQIIHRDISPQNILLSRHGEVKLVDFGIAKAANLTHRTRTGVIKGKLVYMSPEQAWGEKVDQRTDIFSTGIVLYEALTGGSLYMELNPVKLLETVRKAEIPVPSTRRPIIPPELDALVMKALAPVAANRYQTAREFSQTIMEFLRRYAPTYSARELGMLVDSTLNEGKIARQFGASAGESMQRDEFIQPECSIIFSAADLLESSSLVLPASSSLDLLVDPPRLVKNGLLLLLKENDEAKPYEIGDEFFIGRAGELRLNDARVSRRHACIKRVNNTFILEDLGSSNGTFVNDEHLGQSCELRDGDLIRVGPFEMRFVLERSTIPAPSSSGEGALPEAPEPVAEFGVEPTPLESLPVLPVVKPPPRNSALPLPAKVPGAPSMDQGQIFEVTIRNTKDSLLSIAFGAENVLLPLGEKLPLSCTLRLGAEEILGEGAVVIRRSEGYWLEPIAGLGEILHNGQLCQKAVLLQNNDQIQLGSLQLVFLSSSGEL